MKKQKVIRTYPNGWSHTTGLLQAAMDEGYCVIMCNKITFKDKNNNLIKIFNTKAEAAQELGLDSGSITKVCKGQRKTCGGFIWKEI